MVDEKVVELVLKLHQNTRTKKVAWTSVQEDVFQATFPRHSVRIEQVSAGVSFDVVVTITNQDGITVESFSDVDLTNDFPNQAPGQDWFTFMNELYHMARRQSLNADEAIEAILEDLE